MRQVLVGSIHAELAEAVGRGFGPGVRTDLAGGPAEFWRLAETARPDAVFADTGFLSPHHCPGREAFSRGLARLRAACPGPVVALALRELAADGVAAARAGADDYLLAPPDPLETACVVDRVRAVLGQDPALRYGHPAGASPLRAASARNPAMRRACELAATVAPTISTVLLTGETGVGKDLLARYIHALSRRGDGPFVPVLCSGLPDTLLESELFGHEKGAFTGADRRRAGRLAEACGGTVFLDEVGTFSAQAQVKLLRVLQDKVFRPVGGDRDQHLDARVVAATNLDLKALVEAGHFRPDLYYRLNIFPIELPPLRERPEDIPLLAVEALHTMNVLHRKAVAGIHPEVLRAFARYPWPGNVRELRNLMERACILELGPVLSPASFPAELFGCAAAPGPAPDAGLTLAQCREQARTQAEQAYLRRQLAAHHGRIADTAWAAGVSPRQLHKLMRRHGLRKEDYKPSRG
ncbi:MAG: sigma-54 dependent transcriptional regulator [Thermodesulfobacteriota bacterium]